MKTAGAGARAATTGAASYGRTLITAFSTALFVISLTESALPLSRWWVMGWAAPHVINDWGTPEAIFLDRTTGEMLMCDARNGYVTIFDSLGIERFALHTTVSDARSGQLQRGEPRSAIAVESGHIYITDRLSGAVNIYNFRGDILGSLPLAHDLGVEPAGLRAEHLALGANGLIYVSTAGTALGIAVYDQRDSLVATIGYDLPDYQKPVQPGALAVDASGGVWLAEMRGFPVIRHYDAQGRYVGGFARRDAGPKDLSYPSALLCAEDGTVWVADAIRQVVKHYTSEGEFIEQIGGYGMAPGDLQYPSGLAGDGVREIWVCERVGRRVQKYYLTAEAIPAPDAREDNQPKEAVP